jgi:hypothetical protein
MKDHIPFIHLLLQEDQVFLSSLKMMRVKRRSWSETIE